MKVLSAAAIREADQYTITHEPVRSIDLMERAARALYKWIKVNYSRQESFHVFCGSGNNGGDGLALARLLWKNGYSCEVFLINYREGKGSEDFMKNLKRIPDRLPIHVVNEKQDFTWSKDTDGIIIDAIFGSGLNRPVEGIYMKVIEQLNASGNPILAIDIPSGLFADQITQSTAIKAQHTLTFQLPKWSFFFAEHAEAVGQFHILDIKLSTEYLAKAPSEYFFQSFSDVSAIFRPRAPFMHKGQAGRTLLIAGGKGKMGAAVLAAKSCLRSGAGLLTVHLPHCGENIMQTSVPEAMTSTSVVEDIIGDLPEVSPYEALGIGPGMGTEQRTKEVLHQLLLTDKPTVIDADALNLLAEDGGLWPLLANKSLLTPHPGELRRLVGSFNSGAEALEKARAFCMQWKVVMVLKGAYSRIIAPDGTVWFNASGNPGMATGGSGDMLTGILLALVGQGYSLPEAARIGTFVHGHAADLAVEHLGLTGYLPTDGIQYLARAFKRLEETKTK